MSRGTLFAEVVKICEKHRPKAVFCENVKGLYIHDKGNTFKIIKSEFEAIGYHFYYKILNSKDFGVPQHRERIYMVAFRNDYAENGYEFQFPEPITNNMTLNDIRERNVSAKYYLSDVYLETLRRHRARHEAAGHGFGYVVRNWNDISGAIVCGGMGRETNLVKEENGTPTGLVPTTHIHGELNKEGIRKMTPREWARLQGFPEEFKLVLSDVHLYKQFGNSVSIPVIEAIAKLIVAHIQEVDSTKPEGSQL
jgi:DNA (cytosine-5)-methyltransferase 1